MKGIFHEQKEVFNVYEFTCGMEYAMLSFPEQGLRKQGSSQLYPTCISFQNSQVVPRDQLVLCHAAKMDNTARFCS